MLRSRQKPSPRSKLIVTINLRSYHRIIPLSIRYDAFYKQFTFESYCQIGLGGNGDIFRTLRGTIIELDLGDIVHIVFGQY